MFRYLVAKFVLISAAIKEPQWPYSDWEYIWPLHAHQKQAQKQLSVLSLWIANTVFSRSVSCLNRLSPHKFTNSTSLAPQHNPSFIPLRPHKCTLQATIGNVPLHMYIFCTLTHVHRRTPTTTKSLPQTSGTDPILNVHWSAAHLSFL